MSRGNVLRAPAVRLDRARSRRSVLRRLAVDFSWVLLIAGVLVLLDAGATVLWQEPLTALISKIRQSQVDQRLLSPHSAALSPVDQQALAALKTSQRIAYLARRERRSAPTGVAIGRIRIPRIGVNFLVIQGTDTSSLEKGPGHYPSTAFPGLGQTMAIAGHRTTYLAPFRHLDSLHPGDPIVVRMPYGRFTYQVQSTKIVSPDAWWVTRDVGYDRLVLSACNPLYSASQRIVVFARLAATVPQGSAQGQA